MHYAAIVSARYPRRQAGSIRFPHGSLFPVFMSGALSPGRGGGATYRAYLIDENDRVVSYKAVEACSDAEALQAARQFVDGCDVEVWHLDRKIGRLDRVKG
jgi:hypothetical protein